MRYLLLFLICLIVFSVPAVYGNENTDIDEDELFGDDMIIGDEGEDKETGTGESEDEMVEEFDESELDSGIDKLLLKNETVELGGKFQFSFHPSWTWQQKDLSAKYVFDNIAEADVVELDTTLEATIFFDARPDEDFRVFGKTDITAPFTTDEEWEMDDIISIKELFADFTWKDTIFFRAGKHTLKWGVGYFFSPADVLNLTPIDPEDPEAEREGPVSLKTHIPIDIHNLYLYIIAEDVSYPEDIAIAPKFEFVIGNVETGIGAFYQKDSAPMGVLTVTYPFMNGVNMFAEGVLSYGANKRFIKETEISMEHPFGLTAVDRDDEFFFSGTIGFLLLFNQFDTEWESITFAGQYYFNGYGYSDPSIFKNQTGIGSLIASEEISSRDMVLPGMHYTACSLSWSEIFESDFSALLLWVANLSDGSGQVIPEVTWKIMEYMQAGLSFPVIYGSDTDEFSFMGRSFGINLDISLGSGKF